MAFEKIATFSYKHEVTALNHPKGWEMFNLPKQIKTASAKYSSDNEDLDGFDLKTATNEHPDHLYVKVFAIKEDEVNDNGDAFSTAELKIAAPTFVGVPLFTNHQNDDVEKSRGECVHSWYDKEAGGIFIIGRVDKVAYPKLARGIEEGYITGTSMGCSVEYSICSVCHNKAQTSDEYCEHVASRKNKKYSGDIDCKYHKSPIDTDEECPLCKSTKESSVSLDHDKQPIFEHNYGLKFIENSFVVNPACHDCGVSCILHVPELQKKVASMSSSINALVKRATSLDEDNVENLIKIGGIEELNLLKDSMGKLELVVQSMLKQKENVSMDYVSELVKAMADLQATYDELNEMGYARLPSAIVGDATMDTATMGEAAPPVAQPQPVAQPAPAPAPASSGSADMGGLGTITTPKTSSKKIEDFSAKNEKLITKVSMLTDALNNVIQNINNTGLKEIGVDMATNKETKVAAGSENREVITEKQLEKKNTELHPRTDSTYEGITESKEQLGGTEQSNDTTSDSPQILF